MKFLRFLLLAFLAVLSLPLAVGAAPGDYSYARVVRLSLVDGDVQIARPHSQADGQRSDTGWEQAVVNMPIQQGYSVATGRGRAEIEFESGATARLADNSVLQFTELALSGGGRISKMTLTQGTGTFYANLSRDDSFEVLTPTIHVTLPEKASFRVDAFDDGTTVSVLKGNVDVNSRAGTNRLSKGHELTYRTSEGDQVQITRNPKPDEWDRWVSDRDEVIRTGDRAALQYVSSPYSYGLADLYSYGSWYPVAGYGLCWRPYGVGFGWSPFSAGHWAFYPALGWTWISYEPWGWLPYHFGRWFYSPGFGWLWAPGYFNQWQPAVVSWVRVGNHTGWVPLHPHDQPGQVPTNIQHGVIVPGSRGLVANERRVISKDEHPEVLPAPPARVGGGVQATNGVRTNGPMVGPAGTGGETGIVFDPRTRRFENNPASTRKEASAGDAAVQRGANAPQGGPARSGPAVVTPRASAGGAQATVPAARPNTPPPAQPHTVTPQPSQATAPAPRPATPPPPPQSKVVDRPHSRSEAAPRVMPTPHVESAPRPMSPPPATPAPRSSGVARPHQ